MILIQALKSLQRKTSLEEEEEPSQCTLKRSQEKIVELLGGAGPSMEMKPRKTFYEDGNFILEYETLDGVAYLHCRVFKFNTRVLRTIYNEFVRLQEHLKSEGISLMRAVTPNPKFCELFNGKAVSYIYHGLERYEVVEWELKHGCMPSQQLLAQPQQ